ncbi:TPA: DNA polymerase III subunit alpha [Escherichia coli]|nr:DNA polymerase III subunit alpha [Escherichia coli]
MTEFVHLRAHSYYSIEDGLLDTKDLIALAKKNNQPAIAVTDMHKMMNAVNFYEEARKEGIKPIIGADVWIESDITHTDVEEFKPVRMLLIAKNVQGYKNLMHLMSRSYLENQIKKTPYIKQSWLKEMDVSNIIALSGDGLYGEIAFQAKRRDIDDAAIWNNSLNSMNFYKSIFGSDFHLEIQRADFEKEFEICKLTVNLSKRLEIPVVATHPILFEKREDYYNHEVKSCIMSGELVDDPNRVSFFTREQYFKSTAEMVEMFKDMPTAIESAANLYKQCNLEVPLYENFLPNFPTENGETIEHALTKFANDGLQKRMLKLYPDEAERNKQYPIYQARLDRELSIIEKMGFPGYFMIVAEFINWSKGADIAIGPGRGSGAGSLVAYSTNITNVDPLKYNLLFERFLNPDRVSMPDFDIDFDAEKKDQAVEHIKEMYNPVNGDVAVSQIATLGYMKAKAVIRAVGNTLAYNLMLVDEVAKLIPGGPKNQDITIKQALEQEDRLKNLYDNNQLIKRLLDLAMKLENMPKSIGKHAAGIIIAPTKLTDFTPLYLADSTEGGGIVSQYDKNQVEHAGLVKFDFLSLSNLTIIDKTLKTLKEEGIDINIDDIPENDPETYKLLSDGNSIGVFQFESTGMQQLLKKGKPQNLEDLTALVALYRPGPMQSGMLDNYIDRKNGLEEVSYPDAKWQHESLKEILEPTYGIIVYQEQVMQIAQTLAGYSLGEADNLRRAMGKKKPEEMAKQRDVFKEGAIKNGIDAELAMKIFDLVEKFAGYGFNKSHSVAYALISYQTAYLKTHYPAQYYSAFMNVSGTDKGNTDKLEVLIQDARANGIDLLPPDVNEGSAVFTPVGKNKIRYGLAGLKSVSPNAIDAIHQERKENGPFTSLFDFCKRVPRSNIDKRVMSSLIMAGGFDSINPDRASLLASLEDGLKYSAKLAKQKVAAEPVLSELFGENGIIAGAKKPKRKKKEPQEIIEPMLTISQKWNLGEKLEYERRAIGFYFSDHPFSMYKKQLGGLNAALSLEKVNFVTPSRNETHLVAGLIGDIKFITTRKGKKMAFITIEDGKYRKDVTLFDDVLDESIHLIKKSEFIAIEAEVQAPRPGFEEQGLLAKKLFSFDDIQYRLAAGVSLALKMERIKELVPVLEKHKGPLRVVLYHPESKGDGYIVAPLPADYGVTGTSDCWDDLKKVVGEDKMVISYEKTITFEPRVQKKMKM